jgi:hypothetical protein
VITILLSTLLQTAVNKISCPCQCSVFFFLPFLNMQWLSVINIQFRIMRHLYTEALFSCHIWRQVFCFSDSIVLNYFWIGFHFKLFEMNEYSLLVNWDLKALPLTQFTFKSIGIKWSRSITLSCTESIRFKTPKGSIQYKFSTLQSQLSSLTDSLLKTSIPLQFGVH